MQDFLRELQARTDQFDIKGSSLSAGSGSFGENCLLPLNRSQSRLLADLATTFVPRSTWWCTLEQPDMWAMCGKVGEVSGPQVTVFILATSDNDA